MKPILVDTGSLYAMVDRDDGWHDRTIAFLNTAHRQLVIPVTVLPEVCYLIAAHLGEHVEVEFMQSVVRGGFFNPQSGEHETFSMKGDQKAASRFPIKLKTAGGRTHRHQYLTSSRTKLADLIAVRKKRK